MLLSHFQVISTFSHIFFDLPSANIFLKISLSKCDQLSLLASLLGYTLVLWYSQQARFLLSSFERKNEEKGVFLFHCQSAELRLPLESRD